MCCQRSRVPGIAVVVVATLFASQGAFGENAEAVADRVIAVVEAQIEHVGRQLDGDDASTRREGPGEPPSAPLAVRLGE